MKGIYRVTPIPLPLFSHTDLVTSPVQSKFIAFVHTHLCNREEGESRDFRHLTDYFMAFETPVLLLPSSLKLLDEVILVMG